MSIYANRPDVYDNRAQRDYPRLAAQIIADNPMDIEVVEKGHLDKFREAVETIYGPYTVRIEQFRHTRVNFNFDEKGTASHHGYILMAIDVPKGTFRLGRIVRFTDPEDTRTFRVTSVNYRGVVSEVNLDLEMS